MSIWMWFRLVIGTLCLLAGMILFVIEIISIFKLPYVLDRMHAAATGDTSGIGMSLIGLMILNGWNLLTLKLLLVVVFLWISAPVSSHLIAKLEVHTGAQKERYEKVEK